MTNLTTHRVRADRSPLRLEPDERARLVALARRSHEVITEHQQDGGAYPASPTFSAYRGYAWLRDGAFTAEGVSRYGDVVSADRFHDWADGVLRSRAAEVAALGAAVAAGEELPLTAMLPTRFTFDGANGSEPWWDFQSDGYGMWLWAMTAHAARHGLAPSRWAEGARVAVDYLLLVWDRPCYDWWEEHVEHRHPSTLAAVRAGLLASADAGLLDPGRERSARAAAEAIEAMVLREGLTSGRAGDPATPHLAKWFGSEEVDASLAACVVPFGLAPPGSPLANATLDAVRRDLDVDGGVHRFRADVFYGGGQWLLLACLLGWNDAVAGDTAAALRHLRWVADHATPSGEMPEQVEDHLRHPEHRQEWLERWGTVATPLLWSHGMYLILAHELGLLANAEEDR